MFFRHEENVGSSCTSQRANQLDNSRKTPAAPGCQEKLGHFQVWNIGTKKTDTDEVFFFPWSAVMAKLTLCSAAADRPRKLTRARSLLR